MILQKGIKYRRDIDGLRAIAVVSVILFHINKHWISGGFLGVDMFFVISGYLITLILIKEEQSTKKISMLHFYERRIRRIMPALLFVLISIAIVSFLLLIPDDLLGFSKSIIWAFFSAANIYFFTSVDTSYFSTGSSEIPLLHLWSLGVEEQFYIVWPFLVLYLLRYRISHIYKLLLVGVLFSLSLVLAQLTIFNNHSFSYYLLPTRSWELLGGAFVSLLVHFGFKFKKQINELMALIGLFAIMLSLILVTEVDAVPGISSLPAILGTMLLLISGSDHKTFVGNILSMKLLVITGVLSYSAYLWHWPILVFLRYSLIRIDISVAILVFVTTFIMATISYFLVESPLRIKNISKKKVFLFYFFIPSLFIILFSSITQYAIKNKSKWIYPWARIATVNSNLQPSASNRASCNFVNSTKIYHERRCVYPENIKKANVLLIGDSNAAHYLEMLKVIAKNYNFSIYNVTKYACFLIPDGETAWLNAEYQKKSCSLYSHTVLPEVAKYDTIIIGLSWNFYYSKIGFKEKFENYVLKLLKKVNKIIILGKIPVFPRYDKDCNSKKIKITHLDCIQRFNHIFKMPTYNKYLKNIAQAHQNIEYIDIDHQICKKGICSPFLDGKPVYYDGGHLSVKGSRLIGEKILMENDSMLHVFDYLKELEQSYIVPILTMEEDRRFVIYNLHPKESNVKVAFYLYKNDKRIETQWYSSNTTYKFDKKKYGDGKFRISYFIVDDNNTNNYSKVKKLYTGYSKYIYIHKERLE